MNRQIILNAVAAALILGVGACGPNSGPKPSASPGSPSQGAGAMIGPRLAWLDPIPVAVAQESTHSPASVALSDTDRHFVEEAIQGGRAEVELGRLASTHGESGPVKSFGEQMVRDHSRVGQQLENLARSKGLRLPSGVGLENQATETRLSKLRGASFDHAYIDDMVNDHKQDIAAFERFAAQRGGDPQLKTFAEKTLPTLREHLAMAEKIQGGAARGM